MATISSSSSAAATLALPCAQIPRKPSPSSLSFSSSSCSFFNNSLSARSGGGNLVRSRTRKRGFSCNCFFGLGVPELVVIAGVAALVFGPKQLPEVGRSIGKTVKGFQQAAKEFESELKKEPDSAIEGPTEQPTALREEEKQDAKAPSTKESS